MVSWTVILDKALGWLIPAACAAVAGWASAQIKATNKEREREKDRDKDIRNGVQALLRDRIISAHSYYMQKGEFPVFARENVDSMYTSYHALGGNGTVTALVEELKQLPTGAVHEHEEVDS